MIRAIVFDCFGVLTTDGWLPFKAAHFGHDPELFELATSLNKQSDAGLISYHDFIGQIAELAGISVHQAQRSIEDNVANLPLFEFIESVKNSYKVGLLSNAAANWLDTMFTAEQRQPFHAIALSYETGFIKPDERAYQIIADRLGVEVSECVLIDDQERYCTGAREAGMQAIWYKNYEQAVAELSTLLSQS